MAVLKWLLFAILKTIAYLAALVIVPFAVPFAEDGWLPRWLWWLQTPDNSLDGDNGWRTEHLLILNRRGDKWDWLRTYLKRVLWLYRNPCYGFAIDVLGADLGLDFFMEHRGDRLTSNRPGHSGYVIYTVYTDNGSWGFSESPQYWQFYFVKQWGKSSRCLRVNLGWKLWGSIARTRRQFVLSINPLSYFETPEEKWRTKA